MGSAIAWAMVISLATESRWPNSVHGRKKRPTDKVACASCGTVGRSEFVPVVSDQGTAKSSGSAFDDTMSDKMLSGHVDHDEPDGRGNGVADL